jgi:hypothetical protein
MSNEHALLACAPIAIARADKWNVSFGLHCASWGNVGPSRHLATEGSADQAPPNLDGSL